MVTICRRARAVVVGAVSYRIGRARRRVVSEAISPTDVLFLLSHVIETRMSR